MRGGWRCDALSAMVRARRRCEAATGVLFARMPLSSKREALVRLFGVVVVGRRGGFSRAGCPRGPIGLIAGLLLQMKHIDPSNDDSVHGGAETFTGNPYDSRMRVERERLRELHQGCGVVRRSLRLILAHSASLSTIPASDSCTVAGARAWRV